MEEAKQIEVPASKKQYMMFWLVKNLSTGLMYWLNGRLCNTPEEATEESPIFSNVEVIRNKLFEFNLPIPQHILTINE